MKAKASSLDRDQLEGVARLFQILAEPTRLEILQHLRDAPSSVGELVAVLDAKQANVSKQLGVLYDAGLVQRQRQGSQVFYSIREPMIFDLCALVCKKLHRDAQRQAELFRSA